MAQLRREHEEFLNRDTELVVVGPENAEAFKKYWDENDLPFTGIPDPKHSVLKLYGQEVKLFKLGRMPAQAIIDKNGTVRFAHYGHSMADIPANKEIMEILDSINV